MDGRIKIRIGTAIAAAAAAAMLVLAGSAFAQTGEQSPGDLARGDALNKRYHLGKYSPGALAGPRPAGVSSQQWQAELARGDELNRRYGLGSYAEKSDSSAVTWRSMSSEVVRCLPCLGFLSSSGLLIL